MRVIMPALSCFSTICVQELWLLRDHGMPLAMIGTGYEPSRSARQEDRYKKDVHSRLQVPQLSPARRPS